MNCLLEFREQIIRRRPQAEPAGTGDRVDGPRVLEQEVDDVDPGPATMLEVRLFALRFAAPVRGVPAVDDTDDRAENHLRCAAVAVGQGAGDAGSAVPRSDMRLPARMATGPR